MKKIFWIFAILFCLITPPCQPAQKEVKGFTNVLGIYKIPLKVMKTTKMVKGSLQFFIDAHRFGPQKGWVYGYLPEIIDKTRTSKDSIRSQMGSDKFIRDEGKGFASVDINWNPLLADYKQEWQIFQGLLGVYGKPNGPFKVVAKNLKSIIGGYPAEGVYFVSKDEEPYYHSKWIVLSKKLKKIYVIDFTSITGFDGPDDEFKKVMKDIVFLK